MIVIPILYINRQMVNKNNNVLIKYDPIISLKIKINKNPNIDKIKIRIYFIIFMFNYVPNISLFD